MTTGHRGLEQSVMTRLLSKARSLGVEPNTLLTRYGTERFLYRLSRSPHAKRFVLKGAALMPVWLGDTARPTRDADLAGYGDLSARALQHIFREVSRVDVEPDGMHFDLASIRVIAIREADQYGGQRVTTVGRIGRSRILVQIDIGIGDAVSPSPSEVELPSLLDFPAARLRAYHPETSIAEKFHAMVQLGTANSRMKDFYDIDRLAAELSFDSTTLRNAIEATFTRRGTDIPEAIPVALSDDFANAPAKQQQWQAFARRLATRAEPLPELVRRVRAFLLPVIEGVNGSWTGGGPWKERR